MDWFQSYDYSNKVVSTLVGRSRARYEQPARMLTLGHALAAGRFKRGGRPICELWKSPVGVDRELFKRGIGESRHTGFESSAPVYFRTRSTVVSTIGGLQLDLLIALDPPIRRHKAHILVSFNYASPLIECWNRQQKKSAAEEWLRSVPFTNNAGRQSQRWRFRPGRQHSNSEAHLSELATGTCNGVRSTALAAWFVPLECRWEPGTTGSPLLAH